MKITKLKAQYLENPLGLGEERPILNYLLSADRDGSCQSAYRILVSSTLEKLNREEGDLWDSGKKSGGNNFGIVYDGVKLLSRQRVYWKVKVWDEEDNESDWSDVAHWEMGLLNGEDWKGCWIGQGDDFRGDKSAAPMLVRDFLLEHGRRIDSASLYISGDKGVIAQLEVLYEDGELETAVVTDEKWMWKESAIVFQNWYGGEDYDATKETEGWNCPGESRGDWFRAEKMIPPGGILTARECPPIQIVERLQPKSVKRLQNGNWLVDMGHVKEWLIYYVLGIRPVRPAFREVVIQPYIPEDISELRGTLMCSYGEIKVDFRRRDGKEEFKVVLPPGVKAVG